MTSVSRFDALGYAVPFAADFEIEAAADAILDIPASADFDEIDWDAAYDEPTDSDRAWWAEESECDWRVEYSAWLDRLDTLERLAACGTVTDADVQIATGCAG